MACRSFEVSVQMSIRESGRTYVHAVQLKDRGSLRAEQAEAQCSRRAPRTRSDPRPTCHRHQAPSSTCTRGAQHLPRPHRDAGGRRRLWPRLDEDHRAAADTLPRATDFWRQQRHQAHRAPGTHPVGAQERTVAAAESAERRRCRVLRRFGLAVVPRTQRRRRADRFRCAVWLRALVPGLEGSLFSCRPGDCARIPAVCSRPPGRRRAGLQGLLRGKRAGALRPDQEPQRFFINIRWRLSRSRRGRT
jgi:hypothetical protein